MFSAGPGRFVGDGSLPQGTVMVTGEPSVNLHEPRHVRTLLGLARAHGWNPNGSCVVDLDGWTLLDIP